MERRTHHGLDETLCGRAIRIERGQATVELVATAEMAADERGLVHGGFVFGLADHAAMLAINEPTVVLGSASVKLLAPVVVGQRCVADASVRETSGRKHIVDVTVRCDDTVVLQGEMVCFVPPRHVLDRSEAAT